MFLLRDSRNGPLVWRLLWHKTTKSQTSSKFVWRPNHGLRLSTDTSPFALSRVVQDLFTEPGNTLIGIYGGTGLHSTLVWNTKKYEEFLESGETIVHCKTGKRILLHVSFYERDLPSLKLKWYKLWDIQYIIYRVGSLLKIKTKKG